MIYLHNYITYHLTVVMNTLRTRTITVIMVIIIITTRVTTQLVVIYLYEQIDTD